MYIERKKCLYSGWEMNIKKWSSHLLNDLSDCLTYETIAKLSSKCEDHFLKFINVYYWPSTRFRWLDIGRVLFLHFYGQSQVPWKCKKRTCPLHLVHSGRHSRCRIWFIRVARTWASQTITQHIDFPNVQLHTARMPARHLMHLYKKWWLLCSRWTKQL